jgi:hypothetical protein
MAPGLLGGDVLLGATTHINRGVVPPVSTAFFGFRPDRGSWHDYACL